MRNTNLRHSFVMPREKSNGLTKGERRKLLKEERGREITRVMPNPVIKEEMRNERLELRNKYFLECAKGLGLDNKYADGFLTRDREARRKLFGILPSAPYGCMTKECQDQNSASRRSEIDFQNSELGKKIECLIECAESKFYAFESEAEIAALKRKGKDSTFATKRMDEINYKYNSKCGSFKEAENKNKNLYLILGAIVVLLILKK